MVIIDLPSDFSCKKVTFLTKKMTLFQDYFYFYQNISRWLLDIRRLPKALLTVGGLRQFFQVTLKASISLRMTIQTVYNDYFDHLRHVWDIFEPIEPLKIIFWDWIFETFCLKMGKNPVLGLLCLYKGFYYLFMLRNKEFSCLRSEYMAIIFS